MIGSCLIASAAGIASAAMFASITSGALISLVLLYLSPLPLMVAALGWGPWFAALGAAVATMGLGLVFGIGGFVAAFAIAVALPGCWLGHLCLLARPATDAQGHTVSEWYPVGRILLWIAGFATITTAAAVMTLGTDAAAITATLRGLLLRVLAANNVAPNAETERWIGAFVSFAPSAGAAVAMLALTFDIWLAAKVAATSGRLRRPWPVLMSVALPAMTLAVLCLALAICFSGGGLLAIIAQIAASALVMAYALVGFAVLHTLTMTLTRSRPFWLGSVYTFVLVFSWPMLAMAALGLADAVFGLRQRYLRSRPPPVPAS